MGEVGGVGLMMEQGDGGDGGGKRFLSKKFIINKFIRHSVRSNV